VQVVQVEETHQTAMVAVAVVEELTVNRLLSL